jgi:hypothetical protein
MVMPVSRLLKLLDRNEAATSRDCPRAYTAVTPAKGGFMRLTGRLEVKSET